MNLILIIDMIIGNSVPARIIYFHRQRFLESKLLSVGIYSSGYVFCIQKFLFWHIPNIIRCTHRTRALVYAC